VSDQDTPFIIQPVLEEPPASEHSSATGGILLNSGNDFQNAGKIAALEAFLGLIVRDQPFDDFMRDMLLVVMKVVHSEAGSLFEFDHRNQTLFFRSVVGQASDTIKKFTIPLGTGIVGQVAETRKPMLVLNVEENRRHLRAIQEAVGFEARNLVAVPIQIHGKLFGVLELLNRVGQENYTPADLELLIYLCEGAGKAIEARLTLAWALNRTSGQVA